MATAETKQEELFVGLDSCYILYATQSGRAKACARRTARMIQEQTTLQLLNHSGTTFDDAITASQRENIDGGDDVNPLVRFVEGFKSQRNGQPAAAENGAATSNTLLLLFVSTTGDGEQTDTIQQTWKLLLQKSLPPTLFRGIVFSSFNLGDRAYGPQFCAAGRKLAVRLLQLQATLLTEPGYGDDGTPSGGCFRDLDEWIENTLLAKIGQLGKLKPRANENPTVAFSLPTLDLYSVSIEESSSENTSQSNEPQDKVDMSAYQSFFQKAAPVSAYSYGTDDGTTEAKAPLLATVQTNQRITAADHDQDTRHLRLQIITPHPRHASDPNSNVPPYQAGDICSVLPCNSEAYVNRFLSVLPRQLQSVADQPLTVQYRADRAANNGLFGIGYPYWPSQPMTLRGWLTYCADIHALPEREDLRALASFCSLQHPLGEKQRDKLVSLSETTASALYADYVLRNKRTWADVLYDFDSIRHDDNDKENQEGVDNKSDNYHSLTVEALLTLFSPIRIRDFSIASAPSSLQEQDQTGSSASSSFLVELCVAVVEGTTPLKRKYHGLCSHYLSKLAVGDSVRCWIRPGSFGRIPLQIVPSNTTGGGGGDHMHSLETPVLYVCAGTGVAPIRSLIHERQAALSKASGENQSTGAGIKEDLDRDDILIFGCRKEKADFYYRNEWDALSDAGRLGIRTAFSRDQWHKIYVQQVLKKAQTESQFITKHLLERNGAVYIAGGPQMAKYVKEEIVEALAQVLEGGEKTANQFLTRLQRLGKFSVEAWS